MSLSRSMAVAVSALCLTTQTASLVSAQQEEKLEDRAKKAASVLANLVADPKNAPPNKLLQSAECIAVVPSVKEAAMVVGGRVGYGLASCRVGDGWSLPSYMSLKAGSVGFQIGGQATDVALIFPGADARELVGKSNFELGAGASVAAGPVGSTLGAGIDFKKGASVYTYATKGAGLFAGISLSGSRYGVDDKGNRTTYPAGSVPTKADKSPEVSELLKKRAGTDAPASVKPFVDALHERIGARR